MTSFDQKLHSIESQALNEIESAPDLSVLEGVRLSILGKKGALSEVLKGIGSVPPEQRPVIGGIANEIKRRVESALDVRKLSLEKIALDQRLKTERIDISAPGRVAHRGSLHPVTQVTQRIIQIFSRIGFDVTLGPEADTEYLNFDAMNIPADHPARDMQDSFFLGPGVVLRTHTSSVQMRAMKAQSWPIRILCPGAVYRCDSDATHTPMFHQIEGLWVDRGVRMSDLKGTLQFFARELFGAETKIRLRPSYFPFVEPGAEVDVSCFKCRVKPVDSCRICKGTGWLEILGAGMVHPKVLQTAGYLSSENAHDSNITGFAFGLGVERVAMLLYQIPDLRLLFQGDIRFQSQF
jgi:phenylalanyl-tRNA synthetase alpha chain